MIEQAPTKFGQDLPEMFDDIRSLSRQIRRRLKRITQESHDPLFVRRATTILLLAAGWKVATLSRELGTARSTIGEWRRLFCTGGVSALEPKRRGREPWTVTPELLQAITTLLKQSPQTLGYLRSRWSSELLAKALAEQGYELHPSTVRRLLRPLGWVYRRARPTLNRRVPGKTAMIQAVNDAEASASGTEPVFHLDEADIDLNPRMAPEWTPRGKQVRVNTPGKNTKRYLAGALDVRTGRVVHVEHDRKNTDLFLALLEVLRRRYRSAKRIRIVLDNYRIHKSRKALVWLKNNPKFELVFQPPWHPWLNNIERLWKQLHDSVTRNHRRSTMEQLMVDVREFMSACQPFPGSDVGSAKV